MALLKCNLTNLHCLLISIDNSSLQCVALGLVSVGVDEVCMPQSYQSQCKAGTIWLSVHAGADT